MTCPVCGAEVSKRVVEETGRLLRSLDPARQLVAANLYGGSVPTHLCADCFLPGAAEINALVHQVQA